MLIIAMQYPLFMGARQRDHRAKRAAVNVDVVLLCFDDYGEITYSHLIE